VQPAANGAATLVPRPLLVSSSRAGATGWNRAAVTGWILPIGGTTRPSHAVGTKNQFDRRPSVDWKLSPVALAVPAVPTISIERTRPPPSPRLLRAVTFSSCKEPICG